MNTQQARHKARHHQQPAPLYRDASAICEWLLSRLHDDGRVLSTQICHTALLLLDHVVLALKGRERAHRLDQADAALIRLRTLLQLASAINLFDDSQMLYALEIADRIGRQIGGWQRKQEAL